MEAGEQEFFARTIDVSSVDKVLFPDTGTTKGQLVDYYARIAQTMLPHLMDRPVAVKRYPDGLDGEGFFQKNAGSHYPDWLRRENIPKRDGGSLDHAVVDDPATVVYLADQGAIELHPWLSTMDDLEHPVEIVFDLDPPDDSDVDAVRTAARRLRDVLDELAVPSRIKTSGSVGFHVHVPLDGSANWQAASGVAHRIADVVAARHPAEVTTQQRKAARRGRIFLDWLRNGYGQTSVAAYSVRARPGAPVATPIAWSELGEVEPRSYALHNLFRRLGQRDDPWTSDLRPATASDVARDLDQLAADG